jgi:hypothetical protein
LTTFAKSDVARSLSEPSVGSVRGWVDAPLTHLDAWSVPIDHPETLALLNEGFG